MGSCQDYCLAETGTAPPCHQLNANPTNLCLHACADPPSRPAPLPSCSFGLAALPPQLSGLAQLSYLDLSVMAFRQEDVALLACLTGLRALGLEATGNQPAQVGWGVSGTVPGIQLRMAGNPQLCAGPAVRRMPLLVCGQLRQVFVPSRPLLLPSPAGLC